MKKNLKIGVIFSIVAVVAVGAMALPAQALIKNEDIAKNAGISYSKLSLHEKIDSEDIENGSIRSRDIKNESVKSKDIKNGTIETEDISDGAITADKLAPDAFSATIEDDSITSAKILNGTISGADLASNIAVSTTGNIATTGTGRITSAGLLTANGGLTVVGTLILPALSVADSALSANVSLLGSSISSAEIEDGSIVNADINSAAGIVYSKLAFSNNIVAGDIATGAVTTSEILDATIATGDIATGGVTTGNILDGTIVGGDLATNITISTTGNLATTGAGTLSIAGTSALIGATTATGAIYANGGIDRSTAATLTIGGTNANAVDISKSGVATTVKGTFNVDEAATFDSTVGITGNVDANDGLDITGGALNFTGTAGSWAVAEANSALTQTGTGQVTLTGNLDATNGLDVTTANFTTGGGYASTGTTISNAGVIQTKGAVTADGLITGTAGATISGAALTVNNQAITQLTGGQVTFAGNVDANDGLDITGGALNFTGTAGSWAVAEANSALTQTGTGQVTLTGNLDATNGLDVSGAALTVNNQAITQLTGGQVTFAGNVDANSGVDVTGAALTVNNQAITQLTGGQVTFAGNVDANDGVDIAGGALTFTGTAGSWTVAEADSALTQTGTGLVTLTGNLDATNGLDVTTANFTTGGGYASTGTTITNAGVIQTKGAVTADGLITGTAGATISGAALTINNQAITQLTGGQVTFAGNVDANSGVDVSGAALTINNQAITQLTGGQVTFAGNVDANGGLDVTGALTVSTTADITGLANLNGGIAVDTSNFTVSGTTGAVSSASSITGQGLFTTGGQLDTTSAIALHIGETNAQSIVLDKATTVDDTLYANGGIAVDTSNFTVDGTTGAVATAGDVAVNGGDITSTSATMTINPSGSGNVNPGADGTDSLGADATRWSTIYANTLNFKNTLTDTTTNSAVSFGDSANATIIIGDDAVNDSVSITGNTSITDGQWSITSAGVASFASLGSVGAMSVDSFTVGGGYGSTGVSISTNGAFETNSTLTVDSSASIGSNLTVGGGYGSTGVTMSTSGDIQANGDVTVDGSVALGNSSSDALDFQGDITIGHGSGNVISVDSNSWDISTAGVASGFTGITSSGTVDFSGASKVIIPSGTAVPGTCSTGELFVDTNGDTAGSGTAYLWVCTSSNTWTPAFTYSHAE